MKLIKLITAFLLLSSCTTTRYIQSDKEYIFDTIKVEKIKKDSIYIQDSIVIQTRNDTVYKDRWHNTYIDRIVYKDSIKTVIEYNDNIIEKETIKKEKWYKNYFLYVSIILILLLIISIKFKK